MSSLQQTQNDGAAGDYAVGFKRPPVSTRFKAGESGNPKGRPKGSKNLRTIVDEVLNGRVKICEGGTTLVLSRKEVLVKKIVNDALRGEPKAVQCLLTLVNKLGLVDDRNDEPEARDPMSEVMIDAYLAELENHVSVGRVFN